MTITHFTHDNGQLVRNINVYGTDANYKGLLKLDPSIKSLKRIESPNYISKNGMWTAEEMDFIASAQFVVFEETINVRNMTFSNEGVALYDVIRGTIKSKQFSQLIIARSIFTKMYPEYDFDMAFDIHDLRTPAQKTKSKVVGYQEFEFPIEKKDMVMKAVDTIKQYAAKGMKPFPYSDKQVIFAINQTNADKKARKLGLI